MINTSSFNYIQLKNAMNIAEKGAVEYIHSSLGDYGTAFSKGDSLKIALLLPRSLGASSVSLILLSESENEILSTKEAVWIESENAIDKYIVDLTDKNISKGLYFFYLKIQGIDVFYGIKSGRDIIFKKDSSGPKFQLSICDFKNPPPTEKYGGIIYHIFIDRFYKYGEVPSRSDAIMVKKWDSEIPEYPEYPGAFLKNNYFYGGTLYGIIEKLDYIESLGVNTLYLSPIFKAYSNHKYDVGDYSKIDEMFGGEKAFEALITECKKRNISIILDGVFNHTGADSLYFNKFSSYDTVGAYQSKGSEFFNWYEFELFPDKYTCWWGIDILPRINPGVKKCFDFFTGENGIIEKYTKMGADGFRLDVADELSDDFIIAIRDAQCRVSSSSFLYGEVWEDASNKIAYDKRKHYYLGSELDGVMNYPLRSGIIEYIKDKKCENLEYALGEIFMNMPKRIRDFSMNLLGTHDTERILTVLSDVNAEGKSNAELKDMRLSKEEYLKAKKRLLCAYTLISTLPGLPTVFYGDEVGMEGYSDPFNRRSFPWNSIDEEILKHYQKIGKIRRKNSIYSTGDFKIIALNSDILIFKRYNNRADYITIVNNSNSDFNVIFDSAATNLLSGKNADHHSIASESALIFRSKPNNCFEII